MKTEVKPEKNIVNATGNINRYRRGRGEMTKSRPNLFGETVDLDGVCFDCSNKNHVNNYS